MKIELFDSYGEPTWYLVVFVPLYFLVVIAGAFILNAVL